jgi:hypothetical protein
LFLCVWLYRQATSGPNGLTPKTKCKTSPNISRSKVNIVHPHIIWHALWEVCCFHFGAVRSFEGIHNCYLDHRPIRAPEGGPAEMI